MTTIAPTATNTPPTTMDTSEGEKRAHAQAEALSRAKAALAAADAKTAHKAAIATYTAWVRATWQDIDADSTAHAEDHDSAIIERDPAADARLCYHTACLGALQAPLILSEEPAPQVTNPLKWYSGRASTALNHARNYAENATRLLFPKERDAIREAKREAQTVQYARFWEVLEDAS